MRVHHLDCGSMCPAFGRLLGSPGASLLGRGTMVCHSLLVETPRDGLVVVDTGFGTRGAETTSGMFRAMTRPALDPGQTVVAHVARLGFSARDVRHVIVTHLDVDHAGGLGDFPEARVHLHAREHAAAVARATLKERERYVPAQWAHGPKWEVYTEDGETWRGLPAVAKLRGIEADIALVPLHGHTRGHSAIVVEGGGRALVHAGDAYFHRATVSPADEEVPIGFRVFERAMQIDGAQRRASVAALRQLRAHYDDLDVFCAHDPVELAALQARAAAGTRAA